MEDDLPGVAGTGFFVEGRGGSRKFEAGHRFGGAS